MKELSKYFTNEFHPMTEMKRYNRSGGKNKTRVEDLKAIKNKQHTFVKFEPYMLEINHNKEQHIKLWNKTLQKYEEGANKNCDELKRTYLLLVTI